jgi:hypothetical protein
MFTALFGLVEQYLEDGGGESRELVDGGGGEEEDDSDDDENDDDNDDAKQAQKDAHKKPLDERVMDLFEEMDMDNDGYLSFPEFLQLVSGIGTDTHFMYIWAEKNVATWTLFQ